MLATRRSNRMMTALTFAGALAVTALAGAGQVAADTKKPDPKAATSKPGPKQVSVNVHDSLKGTVNVTFTVNVATPGVTSSKTLNGLILTQNRDVASWPEGILIKWEAIPLMPEFSPYIRCTGLYQVDSLKPTIKLDPDRCEKHEVRPNTIVLENTSGKDDIVVRLQVNQNLRSNERIQVYANNPEILTVTPDEEGKYNIMIESECSTRFDTTSIGNSFANYQKPVSRIKFAKDCKQSAE